MNMNKGNRQNSLPGGYSEDRAYQEALEIYGLVNPGKELPVAGSVVFTGKKNDIDPSEYPQAARIVDSERGDNNYNPLEEVHDKEYEQELRVYLDKNGVDVNQFEYGSSFDRIIRGLVILLKRQISNQLDVPPGADGQALRTAAQSQGKNYIKLLNDAYQTHRNVFFRLFQKPVSRTWFCANMRISDQELAEMHL